MTNQCEWKAHNVADFNSTNECCVICQHTYENASEAPHKLPACGHTFHTTCIANWLAISPTCPMCKAKSDGKKLPCMDLCFEHGLVPATSGVHRCHIATCSHYVVRRCTGQCENMQDSTTSPFRNRKMQQIHERLAAIYRKTHANHLPILNLFTKAGMCLHCKQSVFLRWSGDAALSRCPSCSTSFSSLESSTTGTMLSRKQHVIRGLALVNTTATPMEM